MAEARSSDDRVASITLDNAAYCQITVINGASEAIPNDPREPEIGFMVRVFQPWGVYPGKPKEGGYEDGTGHNCDSFSVVITFDAEGAPHVESIRQSSTNYVREFAESERARRERANTDEAKRARRRAEATRLRERAASLETEVGGES
jgi:hypothetical protein